MEVNASHTSPSNSKTAFPQSLKTHSRIGCLAVTSVKMYVRGIAFPNLTEPLFQPKKELLEMSKREWEEITEETFKKVFNKSAVNEQVQWTYKKYPVPKR